MPKYKYVAQDENGKKQRSILLANTETDLYERLKLKQLHMISCKEIVDAQITNRLPLPILADFCSQLGTMLRAGISLVRALNIIIDQENLKPPYRRLYRAMVDSICEGTSFSDAMAEHGDAFPDMLISMMRSAEVTGNFDETATRMGAYYEKQHRLKKKISGSLMYPKILSVLAIVAVVFIITFIVPKFEPIFAALEKLPIPTAILLGLSDGIMKYWYMLLLGLLLLWIMLHFFTRLEPVRLFLDKTKLKIPYLNRLLRIIYTARFANTLCSLYSSGISITVALQTGRHTIGNLYIDRQFDQAIDHIRSGNTLSSAIASIDGFDKKLASVILIGEESGNLDEMLTIISERMDYEADVAVSKLVTMVEPLLIIFMALAIGFIMLAVMLPIFEFYGAIEQSASY